MLRKRAGLAVFCLALALLAARVVWVSTRLESAGDTLWTVAAQGWPQRSLWRRAWRDDVPKGEQAAFWISEAQRVLETDASSEAMLGAAWMLDLWPNSALCQPDHANFSFVTELDRREGTLAVTGRDERESAGRKLSIELALRAARQSPQNVALWRALGTLMLHDWMYGSLEADNVDTWRATLAEAATHDPDNSFYDYLLARRLWRESSQADHTSVLEGPTLTISQPEMFAAGQEAFARAQQRPLIAVNSDNQNAIAEFLSLSKVPRSEHFELADRRKVSETVDWLVKDLVGTQLAAVPTQSSEQRLPTMQSVVRLFEQLAAGEQQFGNITSLRTTDSDIRRVAFLDASGQSQAILPALDAQRVALYRQKLIHDAAAAVYAPMAIAMPEFSEFLLTLAVLALSSIVMFCALMAVATWLVGRYWPADDATPAWSLAGIRQCVCWLLAAVATLLVLGVGPAGFFDSSSRETIARLATTVLPLFVAAGMLVWLARRCRSTAARGWLVLGIVTTGAVVGRFPDLLRPLANWLSQQARVDYIPTPALSVSIPEIDRYEWPIALLQWKLHQGPALMALLALALIATWFWLWSGKRQPMLAARTRRAALTREIRRASTFVAGAGLLLLLALLPTVLEEADRLYQAQVARANYVRESAAAIVAEVARTESDQAKVRDFKDYAEQQLAGEKQ